MSPNLILILVVGVLVGSGVALLLERSLTRVLLGILMLSNGANLLLLLAGHPGAAPIIGRSDPAEMSDPLPQALVLTAIVITLAIAAFLLAMAYRSWQLHGHDEVQDDPEDRQIRERAERAEAAADDDDGGDDDDDPEHGRPDPAASPGPGGGR